MTKELLNRAYRTIKDQLERDIGNEWSRRSGRPYESNGECPSCGIQRFNGHHRSCSLIARINEAKELVALLEIELKEPE